jgi:hypothetical protein
MLEQTQVARIEQLLAILIRLNARSAFPEEVVRRLVATSPSQLKAYNLCDGTRAQAEVAKAAGLDQGNFSRTVTRWIEAGVLFKVGDGREARLLHLYPVTSEPQRRAPEGRTQDGR